jgi:site-specific recombinase XerD
MKKKSIEIQRGHIVVRIHPVTQKKNGRDYKNYFVSDYINGKRKQWSFANLSEAKGKAEEIADEIIKGGAEQWELPLRVEIRRALESIEAIGLSILPACQLFAQAVATLGTHQHLLAACDYWKRNAAARLITAKLVTDGISEYQAGRQRQISFRRHKTETTYFKAFKKQFATKLLHEIEPADVEDFLNQTEKWGTVTRNDFLTSLSAFYRHAHLRRWAPKEHNPATAIKRRRNPTNTIQIFEPAEAQQMFDRLSVKAPEIIPFLALWCFAGIRKDEIGRMTWAQVNQGLTSGFIELQANQTKTGEGRIVPVMDNLRAWLTAFGRETGTVMPAFWLTATKSAENRMDDISRSISRRTGITWKENGPRHSFGTYYFKLRKDPGEVTLAMGTSLQKFQKHYWSKSRIVTEDVAKAWFRIMPK